jgi:general secretion pathway protein K
MKNRDYHQRGLALINALLVVAALSAVAVLLLQRAEGSRGRLSDTQEVAQARANLDGFETLLISLLDADRQNGPADHLKEAWAQKNYSVQIGEGQVSGTIRDMQGKFNLNWLVEGEAEFALEAFKKLMQGMGQKDNLRLAIEEWVSENGPDNQSTYRNRPLGLTPRGGTLEVLDELRLVSGMTSKKFTKIERFLAVYPTELPVNVNTASLTVLQAFMTELPQSTVSAIYAERNTEPFESLEQLSLWFEQYLSVEDYQNTDIGRFGISSRWFEAKISATLGKTHMSRRVIFQRSGETGKTRVKLRLVGR